MNNGDLVRIVTVAVAVIVSVLVLGSALPATASASDSPTVHVDGPVNVSTSTSAEAQVTVADGDLVLSGTATDPDGISHLTVAREFEYDTGDDDGRSTEVERYYATPEASNGSFEHRVPLGTGRNEVNLSVVDSAGYPTKVDIVVHVDDTEPPTATRLAATPDGEWVRIEGWVSDNVQVDTVRAAGQTIQVQTGTRDLDRERVRLDHRVPRPEGDTVTVTVVDQAGNRREVVLPIDGPRTATATPTERPPTTAAPTPAPGTATTTPTATPTGTSAATPPPVRTPTATPESGGASPLGLVGVVIVVGAGLAMLSVGGGGW